MPPADSLAVPLELANTVASALALAQPDTVLDAVCEPDVCADIEPALVALPPALRESVPLADPLCLGLGVATPDELAPRLQLDDAVACDEPDTAAVVEKAPDAEPVTDGLPLALVHPLRRADTLDDAHVDALRAADMLADAQRDGPTDRDAASTPVPLAPALTDTDAVAPLELVARAPDALTVSDAAPAVPLGDALATRVADGRPVALLSASVAVATELKDGHEDADVDARAVLLALELPADVGDGRGEREPVDVSRAVAVAPALSIDDGDDAPDSDTRRDADTLAELLMSLDDEGAADAGEAAVFGEAAELDGAVAGAFDFVDGAGDGGVLDEGLVGSVV